MVKVTDLGKIGFFPRSIDDMKIEEGL